MSSLQCYGILVFHRKTEINLKGSRSQLSGFAKNCLKVDKLKKMFPKSSTLLGRTKRNAEPFILNRTLTERYLNSAVPQMQRMLNCYQRKQNETLRQLTMPVNYGLSESVSLRNLKRTYSP